MAESLESRFASVRLSRGNRRINPAYVCGRCRVSKSGQREANSPNPRPTPSLQRDLVAHKFSARPFLQWIPKIGQSRSIPLLKTQPKHGAKARRCTFFRMTFKSRIKYRSKYAARVSIRFPFTSPKSS